MPKDTENKRTGQRAKIIKSCRETDLTDLAAQQALEYILCYIYPRGDASELAKRLLEKFGTVQAVLDSNEYALKSVKGINERSAKMITGFVRIFDYYMNCKKDNANKLQNWADIYDYCESLVRFLNTEAFYIIALDSAFRVIGHKKLGTGSAIAVSASGTDVINFINNMKATHILFTHNHPGGSCRPSMGDDTSNRRFKEMVKLMHAKFIDHIIVGADGIYSMEFNKKVRSFVSVEDVKEIVSIYKND